ncbi:O-antigen polymerase [Vibrio lentus]|uniref:O-antigen polymerase n=1 Tax=Vibrio lentus TaxID=136468 RepID=UPI000C8293A0|nr:O-antigen polymerase [Vibrio lentus]PMJ05030.1 hypothetical protein BCU32_20345 [Vibrio lentus]
MSKFEFWTIYYNNAELYTFISLIVITTSLLIAKTLRFSVYHPLIFYFFFNFQFALIGVIFLDYLRLIDESLALYFYSAEFVFFLGLLFSIFIIYLWRIISSGNDLKIGSNILNLSFSKLGYEICTSVYILSLIVTYISFGIPLFSESKWSVFASIPLAGVIGRLGTSAYIIIIVYLSVKFVKNETFNKLDKLNIIVLLISGLLSAKKMFFLDYFYIFFITTYYVGYTIPKEYGKKIITYFSIITFFVVGSVYLNQLIMNGIESNPFELVIKRFAMSGDAQILSMPNGIINNLNYGEGFLSIVFYELKGLFSILGVYLDGPSLGVKMMKIHHPYLESNIGPASTFDVFYYVYFRDFSYILALFTGLVIGFFSIFKPRVNGEFALIFWVVISFNSYTLIYNPQIFISNLVFNLIFLLLFWMSIKIRIKQ